MVYRRVLAMFVGAFIAVGPFCTAAAFAQSVASPTSTTQAASVSGVASDNNGTPLSGVTVTIAGPATRSMTTGATGAYAFAGVPAGVYSLSASKNGYQSASASDIALLAGQAAKLDVSLVSQTLSSLRVIGTVRTTARSGFNASGLAVTTLTGEQIANREQPNLTGLVEELPGVTATRDSGGRTPNTSIAVRGASLETKVVIDGHPVSSGVFGTYNSNYANPQIFQQVEVLKGAGLNGPNAGESVGIVNLRTRDFSAKNEFALTLGEDTFGAGNYAGSFNVNLLKNRLSVLGVRSFNSVNGPDNGTSVFQIGTGALANPKAPALEQWGGDFSNPYATEADLLKVRYKLSEVSSLTGEYLGLYGKYAPQGGSYGLVYGSFPLGACANVSTAGKATVTTDPAACTNLSIYNPPYSTNAGTTFNGYGFFPNSRIANNEPSFSLEFKTQLKHDTILLRPYSAIINRFIDGDNENLTPGYGVSAGQANKSYNGLTGWFQVTNPANCQVAFAFDNTNAGNTKGPCFSAANNYGSPYVGNTATQFPTVFTTTGTVPNCTPATPCWTTPTNQQANGYYGFNTPFSQPEVDRLRGATLSYLHPVHDNLYTFSLDYNSDDTLKYTSDTSPLPAGCVGVVGSGVANVPANPYYQPACQVNGIIIPTLPRSSLQIPPTQNVRYDTSVTGLFQLRPNLQAGLGAYYTFQRIYYKITDPAAISAALAAGYAGGEPADSTLVSGINANSHVDPHVQLEYRPSRDLSIRASGGSSVTLPYNGLVSGLTALNVNGGPDGKSDVLTTKNPSLRPETTVAYDLGFDYRAPGGVVLSVDGFNNTIHNVFITSTQVIPNLAGRSPSQTLLNATFNGPLMRSYGLEATLQRNVTSGFGYRGTATLMRAYYDRVPLSFYQGLCKPGAIVCGASAIVNGKQLDGTTGFTGQIPYFKADAQVNYESTAHRWNAALGDSLYGGNNASGGPAYNYVYGNWGTVLGPGNLTTGIRLSLSVQNLLNANTAGTYLGSVAAFKGFNPIGVAYSTATGGLVNSSPYSTPNGITVLQPCTFYLQVSKKLGI